MRMGFLKRKDKVDNEPLYRYVPLPHVNWVATVQMNKIYYSDGIKVDYIRLEESKK
jgi:hypothetical protein